MFAVAVVEPLIFDISEKSNGGGRDILCSTLEEKRCRVTGRERKVNRRERFTKI